MAPAMKIVFGLLTFVTVGMIIGNIHQILLFFSPLLTFLQITNKYPVWVLN